MRKVSCAVTLLYFISALLWSMNARGALPPEYEQERRKALKAIAEGKQANAPEVLTIEVIRARVRSPSERQLRNGICWEKVALKAKVVDVSKTERGFKKGDIITVVYTRKANLMPGHSICNPPVLSVGQRATAYLRYRKRNTCDITADFLSFTRIKGKEQDVASAFDLNATIVGISLLPECHYRRNLIADSNLNCGSVRDSEENAQVEKNAMIGEKE